MADINIGGELVPKTMAKKVAKSDYVYDPNQGGKRQSEINKELYQSEDVLRFDRIITEELPHISATTDQTPNTIVYASFYKRFLAVVDTIYFYAWPNYEKYTDTTHDNKPYDNKVYLCNDNTYVWNGADFVVGGNEQVQVDWNQTNSQAKDFIKNKPTGISAFNNDANYVNEQTLTQEIEGKADKTSLQAEVTRATNAEENLRQLYESLSQNPPIPVTQLPATGEAGKIYRLAGTTSYADYMYAEEALTTPIKMAEYDNAIDDEPTAGSNNLAKSGGTYKSIFVQKYEIVSSGNIYTGIFEDSHYLSWGDGTTISSSGWGVSDYLPVKSGDVLTFNRTHNICFYDSSKVFNNQQYHSLPAGEFTLIVPDNTSFMRVDVDKTWQPSLIINYGSVADDSKRHAEQIRKELLPEEFDIYIPSQDETTQTIFNNVSAIGKKVILLMKNRVIINNNYLTMPNNIYKVIGLGGVFIPYNPQEGQVFTLVFPKECIFECGHYQLFHKQVVCSCSGGFLVGEPNALWWGAAIDRVTDDQVPIDSMMASRFRVLRFIGGNYRAYVTNSLSGRTLIFEPGAVIDGVVHIAYGDYTNKVYCKDTNVIGQVVSTCRVGGAYIDGLYIPNGIKILKTDQIWYNQNKTDAGTAGVHFNISNKNINIGHIEVEEVIDRTTGGGQQYIWAYGLCIDRGDGNEGHEAPHDIYIESVDIKENKSAFFDVALVTCNNIKIGRITCGDGNRKINSLLLADVHDIIIDNYSEISSSNGTVHISGSSTVQNVKIGKLSMNGLGSGVVLNGSKDITIDDFYAENISVGLSVINSQRVLIGKFRTVDVNTPRSNTSSSLDIIKNYN